MRAMLVGGTQVATYDQFKQLFTSIGITGLGNQACSAFSAPSLTASCACDDATFVNCAALSASSSWSAVCAGSDWELCQKSCDANGFSPTGWSAACS